MRIRRDQICVIRDKPRLKGGPQREALTLHGCGDLIDLGAPHGERDLMDRLRRGDTVKLRRLHILVPPKRDTRERPRLTLWEMVHAIEDRGASIMEIDTGRSSKDLRQRDEMIRDAIEIVTEGARAAAAKVSRENGRLGGRPPAQISDDRRQAARATWFDASKMGARLQRDLKRHGYSLARCYREFGPRSGRQ